MQGHGVVEVGEDFAGSLGVTANVRVFRGNPAAQPPATTYGDDTARRAFRSRRAGRTQAPDIVRYPTGPIGHALAGAMGQRGGRWCVVLCGRMVIDERWRWVYLIG
jgi:hypothetical protein